MPEKFVLSHKKGDLTDWFITEGVVLYEKGGKEFPFAEGHKNGFEVCLTFNGVEIPVRKTFDLIDAQLEKMIQEAAAELVKEKCDDLFRKMEDISEAVDEVKEEARRTIYAEFEKLGVKIKRNEY